MEVIRNYFAEIRRVRGPLGILITLVITDGLISHFLIKGGLAREGNPFLGNLVGTGNFLVIKVSGALLCALILWDIYRQRPKMARISIFCLVIVYTGIVFWNLCLFFIS